jgi:hypothetical protein
VPGSTRVSSCSACRRTSTPLPRYRLNSLPLLLSCPRYTLALCWSCQPRICVHTQGARVDLIEAMRVAQDNTLRPGSCTVAVAALQPEFHCTGPTLTAAVLGDAAVRVVRAGEVVFESVIQEYDFQVPFQIGCPDWHETTNSPDDAAVVDLALEEGDVIIMGSDGVRPNPRCSPQNPSCSHLSSLLS